jgi:hypothetical protein|tara:strand:+ start:3250 stop:3690 length:441 start_codon:yes stop_codon:yes gene_type:complete
MGFHFVKLNVNGTYLSLVDPSYKPRYICFQDMLLAEKCLDYVSMFRSKHGVWPSFNMSRKRRKLESVSIKKRTPEQVKRYLEIETYDFKTIDMIATRSNVSFYNVLRFDTTEFGNIESVDMSGQEMDATVDDFLYRDLLEYNLKVN